MNGIDQKEALAAADSHGAEMYALFARANAVRIERRGMTVNLCGVVNARSGACTEDCKFCAQSAHNDAEITTYGLLSKEKIVEQAKTSVQHQARRFGIVTSGHSLNKAPEIASIAGAIKDIATKTTVRPCASLGKVDRDTLLRLKKAGLTRYHCNVETAPSYFDRICTTREWDEAAETIRAAKNVGLKTCSGGIIGLGESILQRIEFLEAVRNLDVDSVPLNFFNPIEGTRLGHVPQLTPLECLKVIAIARLMMPDKEIRVCGGRERNLRDLQSWSLICGADGLMIGGYLTTMGRDVADDLRMIADAGFEIAAE
ncbi:MAG: biotin synthase BioB [Myxococcota bacterium]|nr:biotin synthase BioB [Myxococcota bacterium]